MKIWHLFTFYIFLYFYVNLYISSEESGRKRVEDKTKVSSIDFDFDVQDDLVDGEKEEVMVTFKFLIFSFYREMFYQTLQWVSVCFLQLCKSF